MSLPIVFRRAARAEFDDAAAWYEQRGVGLGTAFTAAVQRLLDQIAASCPPGEFKSKDTRYLDIHEDDQLDQAHSLVKQASQLPGERR